MLAESAPRLVRQIQDPNLPLFARLFTAVVLQAAAAGEALLDKELTDLAQRNPSKFSRLNQRMQVACNLSKIPTALENETLQVFSTSTSACSIACISIDSLS